MSNGDDRMWLKKVTKLKITEERDVDAQDPNQESSSEENNQGSEEEEEDMTVNDQDPNQDQEEDAHYSDEDIF